MNAVELAIVVLGVLTLAVIVVEHLPAVVRARAHADVIRAGGIFSAYDLELAVTEAIRRTDPDVGDDLRDRLAATTVEDLIAGHLHPRVEDVDGR